MRTIDLLNRMVVFFSIFVLNISFLCAQEETYFQQKVDYKIEVLLNDLEHSLEGDIEIKYTNNSSDTLSFLYFHLWPNAYKHQQTAFGKQLLNQGKLDFHFSKKKDRGFIDGLEFTSDGQSISYEEDFLNPDITKLNLPQPINPGETIVIKTPFKVKISNNFSRLAHVDQAYMLCQWYPKPAVYDRDGWHEMPYLDQGEFYSEFGDFDVKITLPQNYVVGATGDLQTESEKKFLEEHIKACSRLNYKNLSFEEDTIPSSTDSMKTIHYIAKNVHDFAWFADKRYYVKKGTVKLKSGKEVSTYIMFTNYEADLWKDAIDYTNRAVKFYSDIVGEYPYSNVTVVQADYKGSDMEYPMVTVIGSAGYGGGLDNVITHEVGHNWFYGVLGSNERDHPWMDEGWNTYMDSRYMSTFYGYNTGMEYLAYLYEAKAKDDQPIESRSQDLSYVDYYVCGYAKPTMSFRYLQEYLGAEELDRILKIYFNTWKFKHPSPKDLRAVFEKESSKDLAWFFDNVINSTKHIDYASTGYTCCNKHNKAEVTIKNKGEVNAPFSVTAFNEEGEVAEKVWVESIEQGKDSTIEMESKDIIAYVIDAEEEMPEINRNDNEIRTYGLFKKGEPVRFKLLADFRSPEKPRINILPLVGFNMYDGVMVGAAIYNLPVPKREWEYVVMPFFGTFTLSPVGMGELKHNSYIKKHRFSHGLSFKTYHKRIKRATEERNYAFKDRYYKITPYLEFELGKSSDISLERHNIRFAHSFFIEEKGIEDSDSTGYFYKRKDVTWRSTHRLSYNYKNKQAQAPMNILTTLEYANYDDLPERVHYLKLSLEANFKIMYSKLWGVDLRVFAGGFLFHTDRDFGEQPLRLVANNRNDYHYDDHIMGRREYDNALAQQVSLREGGFKTAIEPVIDDGSSNTFIFSLNIKSDIPIKLPFRTKYLKIKPFLDVGYYKNTAVSVNITSPADEIFVVAGIMIDIWDGAAGIYLPLIGTENIFNKVLSFTGEDFYKRITFSVNLSRFRIDKLVEEVAY
jgi:hypothetical protein